MKIRFGLVLTLALGIGLTGCAGGAATGGAAPEAPAATPGAQRLAQGERPRNDANTREADRALEDAAEAEDAGNEAQAQTLYQQALTAAEAAIAGDATNPLAWRLAAEASMGLGNWQEADRFLTRAEELRPIYTLETEGMRERAWIGLYQEAAPLVNAGDYEAAAVVFENANAIYQGRPEVFITLGQIYAQLRRHDEALANLDRAVEIINDEERTSVMDSATVASWKEQAADIPMVRAQVLADAGRLEEAVAAFRTLVAEDPDNLMHRRNLATLLVQMGAEAEALEVYDGLMALGGLAATDYYAIGVGYYQASSYEKAVAAFGAAATEWPRDRDALEMWARSLQLDSAYSAIPPVAERWLALDPNNQNAHLILAQASQQIGQTQRAGDLVRAIEALPVAVDNLNLQRYPRGGAQVSGTLTNKSVRQGAPVNIVFTFYGADGQVLGTANTTVQAPATDMSEVFQVDFSSSETVAGYGYEIRTM